MINKMTAGIVAMDVNAINLAGDETKLPCCMMAIPVVIVLISGELVVTNGHRKSLYIPINVKIPSVQMTGRAEGNTTFMKTCHLFAPSRKAASSSSLGNVLKY